ncbi:hypothetical protein [Prosthecobacter sp.]|uniref:hypothetical protein n=1 Tax=Prosthecobacter sp. TaxID=1965333 RepID=UPI003783F9A5
MLSLLAAGLVWSFREKQPADPVIGSADASGALVLHVFSPGMRNPNVARLTTDYGVVLYRSREKGATFVLGDRGKNSVREFGDYSDFVKALGELPSGSVITIYDRCQMPRFFDFYPVHQAMYRMFANDCAKRGLKLAEHPKITCTCSETEWR